MNEIKRGLVATKQERVGRLRSWRKLSACTTDLLPEPLLRSRSEKGLPRQPNCTSSAQRILSSEKKELASQAAGRGARERKHVSPLWTTHTRRHSKGARRGGASPWGRRLRPLGGALAMCRSGGSASSVLPSRGRCPGVYPRCPSAQYISAATSSSHRTAAPACSVYRSSSAPRVWCPHAALYSPVDRTC